MRPQTRVRRMRRPGRHHGRSTDGIRQAYYGPAIRAARNAGRRYALDEAGDVMTPDPDPAVTDYDGQPLATGARVTGWWDGIPYTGTVTWISPQHPGCGEHRHIIVTRDEDQAEMETYSDAVVQPGSPLSCAPETGSEPDPIDLADAADGNFTPGSDN